LIAFRCKTLLLASVVDSMLTFYLSESDPAFDSGGFVAVDYGRQLIVVAFRGTRSLAGLLRNLQARAPPVPPNPLDLCGTTVGCTTSAFFNGIYTVRRIRIMNAIQIAMTKGPGFKIVTTGHSLGGALSQLAAVDLRRNQSQIVDLVQYLFCSIHLLSG
jgi:hypothetical protein